MASELSTALAKVQAELPRVEKGAKASIPGKDGRQGYSYDYADLADVSAHILPLLGKHGLAFTAWPTLDDGRFILSYALLHESGEERTGTWPLPSSGSPQQIGGAITYARRYCLCAVTGVAAGGEDNDAAGSAEVAMDRPRERTRSAHSDPEHVRLRQPSPEDRVNGTRTARGPLPDEKNIWQDVPPEELPGSATRQQVTGIQMAYQKLGFKREERAQAIAASEQIIRRHLTGPNDGRTHNNLSYAEAVKLKDTVSGIKSREELVALMAETVPRSPAAAEASQDAGTDG